MYKLLYLKNKMSYKNILKGTSHTNVNKQTCQTVNHNFKSYLSIALVSSFELNLKIDASTYVYEKE